MNQTEQLPMAFSPSMEKAAERLWLGLAIDHRQLFDALQDEWLRPPERTTGQLLGVRTFARRGLDASEGNRIITYLKLDPAAFPLLNVAVRRDGQWRTMPISEISLGDDAIFWPGPFPTFAIFDVLVSSREESVRLAGLARQVSNVALPVCEPRIHVGEQSMVRENALPAELLSGLVLPPEIDAVRGSMAMAMWAVPRVAPWLDLLASSLLLELNELHRLAALGDASWWASPCWLVMAASGIPKSLQERLWIAAVQVFRDRHSKPPIGASEIVQEIAAATAGMTASDADSVAINAWVRETTSILRADATISLEDWKSAPVGKAIQLVLVRPEPVNFKRWLEDLPELPLAVWWSAASLCGLLSGYRQLDNQFRGEPSQRELISHLSLRACSADANKVTWPGVPQIRLAWRRQSGNIVLSWGGKDFASKPEHARGKWFAADMEAPDVKLAAESMARRLGWPCLHQDLVISDGYITVSGDGSAAVDTSDERRIAVQGSVRMRLPQGAFLEQCLDVDKFRHCVVTEGGANLPAPPTSKTSPVYYQQRIGSESRVLTLRERPPSYGQQSIAASTTEVPGLVYVRDFLSVAEESELVMIIDRAEWRDDLQRRVQHYGWRYDYTARKIDPSMWIGPLPLWAAALAERLVERGLLPFTADQVIVNEYKGKQGISSHVDCVSCFADGIAMISLLESWEMVFKESSTKRKLSKVLEKQSVAVITGDARYRWSHEIPTRKFEPSKIQRDRRISITFRKVTLPQAQNRPSSG